MVICIHSSVWSLTVHLVENTEIFTCKCGSGIIFNSTWLILWKWGFMRTDSVCTGLLKIIVRVLTTCHTQYTWDSSICIFLFNRTTLQVFVTYLTGALCVHPLWFYKHQHDNRVHSKLFVACQRWWFHGGSDSYLQFQATWGKRRNINLILDITP